MDIQEKLRIELWHIQHLDYLKLEVDFSKPIMCLVGRNGSGKTTLIRALRNLQIATTFKDTADPNALNINSRIRYHIDSEEYEYTYNPKIKSLDTKKAFKPTKHLSVEMPIPHGERFNSFAKLAELDTGIRKSITEESYSNAEDLIGFYEAIYQLNEDTANRFKKLKKVTVKGQDCYFILKPDSGYIREDYFSSGEYFALSLFRLAQQSNTLIVVDEFDISLDAAAQVNLISQLRPILEANNSNLLFTTHSLAMMQTLEQQEIYFFEEGEAPQNPVISQRSFGYVKSALFGFRGLDKVILVEDKSSELFLKWLLDGEKVLTKYLILFVGGHTQVISLHKRAIEYNYFELSEGSIMSCLDGDQKDNNSYADQPMIVFLPFTNVEDELKALYKAGQISTSISGFQESMKGKTLLKNIINEYPDRTENSIYNEIFEQIQAGIAVEIQEFKEQIITFLSASSDAN